MRHTLVTACLTAFIAQMAMPAAAQTNQCYEQIGCMSTENFNERALRRLSCQALWETRNRVYQDRGYCFQTERALAVFSNKGCSITDQSLVPLNPFERANIAAIGRAEVERGCRPGQDGVRPSSD